MLFLCQQHLLLAGLLGRLQALKQTLSLFCEIHQSGAYPCHASQESLRSQLWPFNVRE